MFAELATQDPRYLMLQDQLETMRMGIFRADVWRSLLFIVLSAVPLWLFAKGYLKAPWLCCILVGLTLVDLWQVDKRYLSDDDFILSLIHISCRLFLGKGLFDSVYRVGNVVFPSIRNLLFIPLSY